MTGKAGGAVEVVQEEGIETGTSKTRPEVDRPLQAVSEVLSRVDLGSPEARLGARRELCRIGGGASSSAIADSQNWSLWISVLTIATTNSDIDQRERIGLALAEGYESVTSFWEGIYRWLMEYLGFRPRRPMTVRQFTMAVTAMREGLFVAGTCRRFHCPDRASVGRWWRRTGVDALRCRAGCARQSVLRDGPRVHPTHRGDRTRLVVLHRSVGAETGGQLDLDGNVEGQFGQSHRAPGMAAGLTEDIDQQV